MSGRIQGIISSLAALAQTRLALLAVEVRVEKHRMVALLVWAAGLAGLSLLALLAFMGLIVVVFWEQRAWVLAGFLLLYAGAALWAWRRVRQLLSGAPPFSATIEELKKDRECLGKPH